MSTVRVLNQKKYQISKHRFLEVYHYCLQYHEWQDELNYKTNTVGSPLITDMPRGSCTSDATQTLAMRRKELSDRCKLIEQTAIETDADIYQYILKAVTNEDVSYYYLNTVMGIPCCRNTYYDRRRKFYWLLSSKL